MFRHLKLNRPLAVLDLETTGTDVNKDRIVEISIKVIGPDGSVDHRTKRCNPEMAIPAAATAVHHIHDDDVKDQPTFQQYARGIAAFMDGCDLCGFNLKRFDLRLLVKEFDRAKVEFSLEGRRVLDLIEIYHTMEKRGLEQAVKFYLGRDHTDAHSAQADVEATADLIDAMLEKYGELPRDVPGLTAQFNRTMTKDSDGFFIEVEGRIQFARSKHRGQPLEFVAKEHPDFLEWMLRQNFGPDTMKFAREALAKRPMGNFKQESSEQRE